MNTEGLIRKPGAAASTSPNQQGAGPRLGAGGANEGWSPGSQAIF